MRLSVLNGLDAVSTVQKRTQPGNNNLGVVSDAGAEGNPRNGLRLVGAFTAFLRQLISVDNHDATLDGGINVGVGDLPFGVNRRGASTHSEGMRSTTHQYTPLRLYLLTHFRSSSVNPPIPLLANVMSTPSALNLSSP